MKSGDSQIAATTSSRESDPPVFEEIEARSIAALQKRIDHGKADHPTASAQLVQRFRIPASMDQAVASI